MRTPDQFNAGPEWGLGVRDPEEYPFASTNQYGTPVTLFLCNRCGQEYSVCPAVKPEDFPQWSGCLADTCPSYDMARDFAIFGDVLLDQGWVHLVNKAP